MEGHLKAWRTHRALAWLYGLTLVLAGVYLYLPLAPTIPDLSLYAAPLPVLLAFHALCARGARLRRPWARIASLAAGFVLLLAFPLGTIIGIYLLLASWQPWPEQVTHVRAPSGGWPQDAVRDRPRATDRR